MATPDHQLPIYEFSGSPEQVGYAHGETLRPLVQGFVAARHAAAQAYFAERGIGAKHALAGLETMSAKCLALSHQLDPEGYREHQAIAAGANVDPVALYLAAGYTDIRDAFLALPGGDSEGCTATLLPAAATATQQVIGAQTWDLNPDDLAYVVAIKTTTTGQPSKWSVGTAGGLCLMGMNEYGMAVGTTNVKTKDAGLGLTYINLLHLMLRQPTPAAVQQCLKQYQRAGAHTYWLAHEGGAWGCEATPGSAVFFPLEDQPRSWANHCLVADHARREFEPPSASSLARTARMQALMTAGAITPAAIVAAFADRQDGVNSINRYPEDQQGTTTNACLIALPATRSLLVCKGPADRGQWVTLTF